MNPFHALNGMFQSQTSPCNNNAFSVIIERLTATIDGFGVFSRVDDTMRKSDPMEGMREMVVAQIKAAKSDGEEWRTEDDASVEEEAFEDKGRMHITYAGSLRPIMSLFTVFNYIRPSDSAKKDELGRWTVSMSVRDKRIIEKYGTEFKNFSGSIFNEEAFAGMLKEIEMILKFIIEVEKLPTPDRDDPNGIDLSSLPYALQLSIRNSLGLNR